VDHRRDERERERERERGGRREDRRRVTRELQRHTCVDCVRVPMRLLDRGTSCSRRLANECEFRIDFIGAILAPQFSRQVRETRARA
jgi:hypothetical protein